MFTSIFLNREQIQEHLLTLLKEARGSWTYAIFWWLKNELSLKWGEGYFQGEEEDKEKGQKSASSSSPCAKADQDHRKNVLRNLGSFLVGTEYDPVDETVTDTEWFFLNSLTQTFQVYGYGLPGEAFSSKRPVWLTGTDELARSTCKRAFLAPEFGLKTLAFLPTIDGVIELGSTSLISRIFEFDLFEKYRNQMNSIKGFDIPSIRTENGARSKTFDHFHVQSKIESTSSVGNSSMLKRKLPFQGDSQCVGDSSSDNSDINTFVRILRRCGREIGE